MAKTVATTETTTTETVVTKPTATTKTYTDGVKDGYNEAFDAVLNFIDGYIEINKGVGYIHALESIRDGIKSIK